MSDIQQKRQLRGQRLNQPAEALRDSPVHFKPETYQVVLIEEHSSKNLRNYHNGDQSSSSLILIPNKAEQC